MGTTRHHAQESNEAGGQGEHTRGAKVLMKTFTSTKHFTLGQSIIAQCTGAERPADGETILVNGTLAQEGNPDGEQWVCTSAAARTGGWKLRLMPTEDHVKLQLAPV